MRPRTSPTYYLELAGAGHFAWTDLNHRFAASVFAYSAAFLDHYVKGDPASADLTGLRRDVSRLLYDSELGRRDSASR